MQLGKDNAAINRSNLKLLEKEYENLCKKHINVVRNNSDNFLQIEIQNYLNEIKLKLEPERSEFSK